MDGVILEVTEEDYTSTLRSVFSQAYKYALEIVQDVVYIPQDLYDENLEFGLSQLMDNWEIHMASTKFRQRDD